jgi:hypothetical protein
MALTQSEAQAMIDQDRQLEINAAYAVSELCDPELRAAAYHMVLDHMRRNRKPVFVRPSSRKRKGLPQ